MLLILKVNGRRRHQLSINAKRDEITKDDLLKVGKEMNIKKAKEIIEHIKNTVADWSTFAKSCGIPKSQIDEIARNQKVNIQI